MDRIEDNILIFVSGSTSFVPTRKKQLSLLKYTCRSFYLVQLDEKRGMRENVDSRGVWTMRGVCTRKMIIIIIKINKLYS